MNCLHCHHKVGNYSNVEYRTIENKLLNQKYWFCHNCALKVYDDKPEFVPEKSS